VIHTVVCTDVNDYIDWQCELLEYSWARVGQPGELLRLVCAPADVPLPSHRHARVVRIAEPSGRTGGYGAFERLFSLQDWLQAERPQGSVLVIDPDCVFRTAIDRDIRPGAPVAQRWVDFQANNGAQPATWPALFHSEDLLRLLPGWINMTRALYSATKRWESDMFGLVSAAASLKIEFSLENVGAFVGWPDEEVGDAPIVHYCQDVLAADGRTLWSKRGYTPWEKVGGADQVKHAYCRDLLDILNEFAELKSCAKPSASS